MSFLVLKDIAKTFPGGTVAVERMDLSIEAGQFIVLLGPSGCGKTTTLRMVAGLEIPSAGTIRLDGKDVTPLRPSRRDVGFVFQFYALYPHLNVEQNIAFPLASAGVGRKQRAERMGRVIEHMSLGGLLRRYPSQLSGGDQQRVSLARAMVRSPRVYLMDEPLGTLDADERLAMREFIRAQQIETRVTTIYVTHDQEEAMSLADRIVVMNAGRIVQVGSPMEVYDNPVSLFVANFVGSPGMNFIPGQARTDGGRTEFAPDGDGAAIPVGRELPDGAVTLGVRPEYVRVDETGPVAGKVVMNEYQGGHRFIHVDTGFASNLVARVAAADDRPAGQAVRLSLDPAHTRFFDTDSGEALR